MDGCFSSRRIGAFPLVVALTLAACGGGGDSPKAPSTMQLLLSDGDTLPGGFVVNTIESANMSNDQTVALIASQPGTPTMNGVFVRYPGGDFDPVLTPDSALPEGLSLTTVKNLTVAGTSEFSFEVGAHLDDDAVFLHAGGRLSLIARTEPGSTPPGFRVLGERRIGNGGAIVFAHGTSPCDVDASGGSERVTCIPRIYYGDATGVSEVSGLPLDPERKESLTAVSVVMSDSGRVVLGLPARGRQSLVGEVVDGSYRSLFARGDQIGGFGELVGAKPRVIGPQGELLIDARFDTDGDDAIDKDRILLLRGGELTDIAETGVPAGKKTVIAVRGIAVDEAGRVTFSIEAGDPGDREGGFALRQWEAGATRDIAYEGQGFGEDDEGNDVQILEIAQVRAAPNGDVVYVARIGFYEEGTRRISETRLLRDAAGAGGTLLRTGAKIQTGALIDFSIADLNDSGDLLLIAGVNRKTNRALLLLPRQ